VNEDVFASPAATVDPCGLVLLSGDPTCFVPEDIMWIDVNDVCEFDLALAKILSPGQSMSVAPGDDVSFDVTVYNQGDFDAYNTIINDYVPNGYTFDPALNTDFGPDSDGDPAGSPDSTIPGPLVPGDSVVLTIVLTVNDPFDAATMDLVNYAEISYTEDEDGNNTGDGSLTDVDSTPDTMPGNWCSWRWCSSN